MTESQVFVHEKDLELKALQSKLEAAERDTAAIIEDKATLTKNLVIVRQQTEQLEQEKLQLEVMSLPQQLDYTYQHAVDFVQCLWLVPQQE